MQLGTDPDTIMFNGLVDISDLGWGHALFHLPRARVQKAVTNGVLDLTVSGQLPLVNNVKTSFMLSYFDVRAPRDDDMSPVVPLPCKDSTKFFVPVEKNTAAHPWGCVVSCPTDMATPVKGVCYGACETGGSITLCVCVKLSRPWFVCVWQGEAHTLGSVKVSMLV